MDARTLVAILRKRRALRRHERWSRLDLEVHQARAVRELRDFAVARSPFYARLHRGLERRPLHELPVVTKADLMAQFDEVVTDRQVQLKDLRAFVDAHRDEPAIPRFHERYWTSSTSGSTGMRGIFLHDFDEWTTVIASYARANEWAGMKAGLGRTMRLAVVSSRVPTHQSAAVGATLQSRWVPTLRVDATEPMPQIVAKLNAFAPEALVGYASMIRLLADERLAGRLTITPQAVTASSEVISPELREHVRRAFGTELFEVYAATEPAGIASHCERHALHLYEDLVITEVVDEHERPVPPGAFGDHLLVTVLFGRTMPLIRYAMSDSVRLSSETCPCGRPFALLDAIQGRREDLLRLPGRDGADVVVQPNLFHRLMEPLPLHGWQIVQEPSALRVRLVDAERAVDDAALVAAIENALAGVGALAPRIAIERVDAIARTRLGKAPLVIASP
ncbi:MAG: phenylacetate--CoA ligase family protein [Deltaproteobacteria bacterium]|nr:phenylacetate--CoA ligase family protein [Deltaproteobacteria bacterium]